jgi:hypothetical protein
MKVIPWFFGWLNALRLTEPRSAGAEINLGNTPLIQYPSWKYEQPGKAVTTG